MGLLNQQQTAVYSEDDLWVDQHFIDPYADSKYQAEIAVQHFKQAGGVATNGKQRIMDIQPEKLHQRVPVFLGSKKEVELVTSYHNEK